MDHYDAVHGRSAPKAAADLPTDDAGVHEFLHATPQHPTLLCFAATTGGGTTSHPTDLPASLRAMDAVGAKTTADLPTDLPTVDRASPTATANVPADSPAVVDRLHGPL
jgi:hypothetical protein